MAHVKAADMPRVNVRIHPDTLERVRYWAEKRGQSANEYIVNATEAAIARENGDYDLPTLEQQRLAQLIDAFTGLESEISSLKDIVTKGNDALLGMVRGDNYLTDDDDGELGSVGQSRAFGGGV